MNSTISIILAIIGIIGNVTVAVVGGLFAREKKKQKEEEEAARQKMALHEEKEWLTFRIVETTMRLASHVAIFERDGAHPGDIDKILDAAAKAEEEYLAFLERQGLKSLA